MHFWQCIHLFIAHYQNLITFCNTSLHDCLLMTNFSESIALCPFIEHKGFVLFLIPFPAKRIVYIFLKFIIIATIEIIGSPAGNKRLSNMSQMESLYLQQIWQPYFRNCIGQSIQASKMSLFVLIQQHWCSYGQKSKSSTWHY